MLKLLEQLLAIPSPTFKEQEIVAFIKDWSHKNFADIKITESFDSIIIHFPETKGLPHISLVGQEIQKAFLLFHDLVAKNNFRIFDRRVRPEQCRILWAIWCRVTNCVFGTAEATLPLY